MLIQRLHEQGLYGLWIVWSSDCMVQGLYGLWTVKSNRKHLTEMKKDKDMNRDDHEISFVKT